MSLSALLAPLSLPLASLFAIPMLSSWSTSLNLVFFSLTWTTIALTYTPLQLEFLGPLFIRITLYILPSILFLLFDLSVPSLAVEIKAQGAGGLPGRQRGGVKKVRAVVAWSVVNVLLGVALQAGVEYVFTGVFRMRSLLLIKGSAWTLNHLPNPWGLVKHAIIGIVSRNILQYYIHAQVLHNPSGGIFAHWHQTWHHSINSPYSLIATYDHPACYLIHRFLPLYLPAILLRMHILTYLLLLAISSLEELFTYSGYTILPSTIMLKGMARRVDAHMMSEGDGNFGPLGVLDWCHGTTLGADVVDDLKKEMEAHNVEEKAGKAVAGVGNSANSIGNRLKSKARGRGNKE